MNTYTLDSTPRLRAFFTDEDGPTDPFSVTASITAPNGTVTAYTQAQLANPAVGEWTLDVLADQTGTWTYTFFGAGAINLTRSGSFRVTAAGTTATAGGCSLWATLADLDCTGLGEDGEALVALEIARDTLYDLTGRWWPGECSDTVYPCLADCWGTSGDPNFRRSNQARGLVRRRDIRLPGYPVTSVDVVSIDGVVVDSARYRVEDDRWLVFQPDPTGTDTRKGWPACPDISEHPFSVTYNYGRRPPRGGVRSAAYYACQLGLAWAGSSECQLPERVTTIARQGVTLAVLDPLDLLDEGKTGLPSVDAWVASVLMGDKRRRATVWLPGRGQRVRRVTA